MSNFGGITWIAPVGHVPCGIVLVSARKLTWRLQSAGDLEQPQTPIETPVRTPSGRVFCAEAGLHYMAGLCGLPPESTSTAL
ncbi:hypothetical protein [Labrenzia sp. OB1]|uniref:hypothetical protein n=1 Tax=Labrenzia sp. OB1 TaxID=1561204 RepID=UPI0012E91DF5|nr:hypothetical protein [Labrenzia sp. OB1]